MTPSSALGRSETWTRFGEAIARKMAAGEKWQDVMEIAAAINLPAGLEPYRKHRARLDELLWHDDPEPKTIIDLGAGYGAMANVWPMADVYNVDLPEMLEVQYQYLARLPEKPKASVYGVPYTEADRVPVDGAYLFSAWALTETTRATWDYWVERAPRLAGIYVIGHRAWEGGAPWPWDRLLRAFKTVRAFEVVEPDSWELAAVNR